MKRFRLLILLLLMNWMMYAQGTVDGLKFNHKVHQDNEIECLTCHQNVETSQTGTDNLIPEMDVCADCHDIENENECATCHLDVENNPNATHIIDYNQKFSHERHLKKIQSCTTCHQMENEKILTVPEMKNCINCHENKTVSTECSTCHMPGENLKPGNHTGDFLHTHGQLARTNGMSAHKTSDCNTCHTVNQCQECHQGENLDRLTHPLNFAFSHSLEARGKEKNCQTCHAERSFCIDCHKENQVLPGSHRIGWVNNIPGDGGMHKVEARMDLENCMACHETDASVICQPCHGN
jgi:hypothetical protein